MKRILILLSLFLLTGCEAVYNIEIKENKINNEILYNNYDKDSWNKQTDNYPSYKTLIDYNFKEYTPTDKNTTTYPEIAGYKEKGASYYQKELINTDNNYGLRLNHSFSYDEFRTSQVKLIYGKMKIINNNDNLKIESGVMFGTDVFNVYPLLDTIYVNIKSDYKVINNNADKVENDIYTWVINKDNRKQKNIIIEVDKNKVIVNPKEKIIINSVLIGLAGILIISSIVIYIKVKNSNK